MGMREIIRSPVNEIFVSAELLGEPINLFPESKIPNQISPHN
jgi:hypothetical protein